MAVPKKRGKRELDNKSEESPSKKVKTKKESKSNDEYATVLQQKMGVLLPQDFYSFFDFIQNGKESMLSSVGLYFTGPYDILLVRIPKDTTLSKEELHMHGRHYYDTPEMMTVLHTNKKSGFHIGYFRDNPSDLPQLLVSNKSEVNGELSPCGDNIFAAVHIFCKGVLKSTKDDSKIKELNRLCKALEVESKKLGYLLDATPPSVQKRKKNIVAATFHKVGIIVTMDQSGVGYRELPVADRKLKNILSKIAAADTEKKKNLAFDELDEIITLVQFANDECDYGMGLELGIDLFVFGHESLRSTINHLLPLAYQLTGRNLYADIITKHMENRKKDGFISMIV